MSSESLAQPSSSARQAERFEWIRFWKIALVATIIPFLCLLAVAEWVGWRLGETYTPQAMARAQAQTPGLVWMGVRVQAHARNKLAILADIRPDVVIMGQSRLGQTRAGIFAPYSFYNLSRVSWPFNTYAGILRHFPAGYRPKLIIFDADFFMFGSQYDAAYNGMGPVYDASLSENLIEADNVATEILEHPALLWKKRDYDGHPTRGIYPIKNGDGFRTDGSERPLQVSLSPSFRRPEAMIGDWKRYITGGAKMEQPEMDALKQFVDLGHKMGIQMVAVQMPFYGPTFRQLDASPNYGILNDFRAHVAQGYFDQLGIPFFDFETFPPYSEDYHYFYDGVHPGEPLTAMAIEKILSDPRVHAILPQWRPAAIDRQLEQDRTASDHLLFPP